MILQELEKDVIDVADAVRWGEDMRWVPWPAGDLDVEEDILHPQQSRPLLVFGIRHGHKCPGRPPVCGCILRHISTMNIIICQSYLKLKETKLVTSSIDHRKQIWKHTQKSNNCTFSIAGVNTTRSNKHN
jgi:hypothetical protein